MSFFFYSKFNKINCYLSYNELIKRITILIIIILPLSVKRLNNRKGNALYLILELKDFN